jgi:hypothetical protein
MIWDWLKGSSLLRDLDRTLAIAGAIFSIILIIYLGREIGRVIYLLTGLLALISCLLWLAIRKSYTFEFHLPASRISTSIFAICFFGLYILSVLSVYFRPELYERPLLYFILTAFMAGIIACEIFTSSRRHASLIIVQILLLGVSVAWSQLLIFPSLLGVDPWHHSAFTNGIIAEGFIPEGYLYAKLPLFHLMITATSLIADLPYKFATMLSVSLGQVICNAVFVVIIANYLFKNHRIGLLAALMVVIANRHISMAYGSVPNAFAAVFIPIALYLLFFKFRDRTRLSSTILYTIVLTAIILTHTISAMCTAMLLFVAWGALAVYRIYQSQADNRVSLVGPTGFTAAMFAWWIYAASGNIRTLANLIDDGFSADYFVNIPHEFKTYAVVVPFGEQLFINLGMFLFFAISFIGIFCMISRKGSCSSFAMAWIGITPLAIGFFSLISGHSVIESRWWYFSQILLSIPLAVAICIVSTWKTENPRASYCFVFGFVALLSFLMIMSPTANVDNHILSPITGTTAAYTQSEMIASEFFAKNTMDTISSDRNYCTNPSSSVFSHLYGINSERLHCLDDSLVFDEYIHDGSMKIIRSKWFREPFKRGGFSFHIRQDLNEHMSNLGFNKVYNNPMMSGYC